MPHCPTCQKEFSHATPRCENCGYRMSTKQYYLAYSLVVLSFMLSAYCIYFFMPTHSYQESPLTHTIDSQLEALRNGDIDKAYSYLATSTTASVSQHKFQSYIASYPIIKNNNDANYSEVKITDNKGYVKGSLKNQDNKHITLEYLFAKENDEWKISAMRIKEAVFDSLPEDTSHTYIHNYYTIIYPSDWRYNDENKSSVDFIGKEDSPSAGSMVTVQIILSSKNGGLHKNTREVMDDLQNQISKQAQAVKFTDSNIIDLPSGTKHIHGEYFIATYLYNGRPMKKMQFVLGDERGSVFYTWSFTASSEQFDNDLPVAKAMFETWKLAD